MKFGMVSLTPEQQQEFVRTYPESFAPGNGAGGRQGATSVQLDAVDEETAGEALTIAWRNAVEKGPAARKKQTRKKAT